MTTLLNVYLNGEQVGILELDKFRRFVFTYAKEWLQHGRAIPLDHVMEYLLSSRLVVDIWDKYPQQSFVSVDLESAATEADIILFCLPITPHREIAALIAPLLKKLVFVSVLPKDWMNQGRLRHKYSLLCFHQIKLIHYSMAR